MPRSRSTLGHRAATKSFFDICDALYVVPSHSASAHASAEIQPMLSGSWAVMYDDASGLDWKVLQSAWLGVYWTRAEGDGLSEGGGGEGDGSGGEGDGSGVSGVGEGEGSGNGEDLGFGEGSGDDKGDGSGVGDGCGLGVQYIQPFGVAAS